MQGLSRDPHQGSTHQGSAHQGASGPAASKQLPAILLEGPRAATHAADAAGSADRTERRQSGNHAAQLPDTMTMGQRHGALTRVRSSRAINVGGGGRGGLLLGEQGTGGVAHAAAAGPSPLSRAASRPATDGGAATGAGASGAAAGRGAHAGGGSVSAGGAPGSGAAAGGGETAGDEGRGAGSGGAPVMGFRRASLKALNVPQGGKGGFERVISSNGRNKQ